jgi:hypothetical protein
MNDVSVYALSDQTCNLSGRAVIESREVAPKSDLRETFSREAEITVKASVQRTRTYMSMGSFQNEFSKMKHSTPQFAGGISRTATAHTELQTATSVMTGLLQPYVCKNKTHNVKNKFVHEHTFTCSSTMKQSLLHMFIFFWAVYFTMLAQ